MSLCKLVMFLALNTQHFSAVWRSARTAYSICDTNDFRPRIESGDFDIFGNTRRAMSFPSSAKNRPFFFHTKFVTWGFPSPNPENKICFAMITHIAQLDEDGWKCLSATPPYKMDYVQAEWVNAMAGFIHHSPLIYATFCNENRTSKNSCRRYRHSLMYLLCNSNKMDSI